jgi:hypothetical protein
VIQIQQRVLSLFEKEAVVMNTPSILFHMNTLGWMWKNVLICWVISPTSFLFQLVGGVCLWWNNFRLQVTKSIFFQLPMKAYKTAYCVEVSQQIKL